MNPYSIDHDMMPGIDREQEAIADRQTRPQAVTAPRNPSMNRGTEPPGHARMRRRGLYW